MACLDGGGSFGCATDDDDDDAPLSSSQSFVGLNILTTLGLKPLLLLSEYDSKCPIKMG